MSALKNLASHTKTPKGKDAKKRSIIMTDAFGAQHRVSPEVYNALFKKNYQVRDDSDSQWQWQQRMHARRLRQKEERTEKGINPILFGVMMFIGTMIVLKVMGAALAAQLYDPNYDCVVFEDYYYSEVQDEIYTGWAVCASDEVKELKS